MNRRIPPTGALWILERCGPSYQREALTGDLIEQFQQGETRWWFWRQVAAAIVVARVARIQTMSWLPVLRVFSHLSAELGVVLGMCAVVDQSRHAHSFRELCTPTFTITIAALSAAIIGASCLAIWTSRQRHPGTLIRSMAAAFAIVTLGFGALTWAATVRSSAGARAQESLARAEVP